MSIIPLIIESNIGIIYQNENFSTHNTFAHLYLSSGYSGRTLDTESLCPSSGRVCGQFWDPRPNINISGQDRIWPNKYTKWLARTNISLSLFIS